MKGTKDYKGLKVTVKLTIQNRKATVSVMPSAATLLIKALKEPLRDRKKVKDVLHDGDISMSDVYDIAKVMRCKSMARNMGCTVKGMDPHEVIDEINSGEREIEAFEAP